MVSKFFVASVLSFIPLLYAVQSMDFPQSLRKQIFQQPSVGHSNPLPPPPIQIEPNESTLELIHQYQLDSGAEPLMATVHRQRTVSNESEVLRFWFGSEHNHTLAKTLIAGWEGFQKPVLFAARDERFIYVATQPAGSGGFVDETILWIAPDHTMQDVDFHPAADALEAEVSEDEIVLSGGANQFAANGELSFEFDIARKGDPHCCPTAGHISGKYKLVGGSAFDDHTREYRQNFQIVIDTYERAAAESTIRNAQR